jgi:hypothetical protein
MQIGETFVMGEGGHLWIVISDPIKHANEFIIVNITTKVERAGTDCELVPGDHPFITDLSYVTYGDARRVTPQQEVLLVQSMNSGAIIRHAPMRQSVLNKIVAAGKTSTALPVGFKVYL